MSVIQSRKRAPNWQFCEKELLISLVEKHLHVVENKRTDGASMREKIQTWEKIEKLYNSDTTLSHRSSINLKAEWETLKKAAKKSAANRRKEANKTGGGLPSNLPPEDPVFRRVLSLISPAAVGLYNPYDSDASMVQPIAVVNVMDNGIEIDNQNLEEMELVQCEDTHSLQLHEFEKQNSQNKQPDWSSYNSTSLRTPISNELHKELGPGNSTSEPSSRRPVHNFSLERLHEKKIEILEMEKKFATEERNEGKAKNALELQILREKNVLELEILREKNALELEILREKSVLELEIMREKLKQERIKSRMLLKELKNKNI